MRRLSLVMKGVSRPEHHIHLSKTLKADLLVWECFLQKYNGRTCCQAEEVCIQEVALFADAARSQGFGAIFGSAWCADKWPEEWVQKGLCKNLTLLELFPVVVVVVAAELWGPQLRDKRVCFWMDNMGAVSCINTLISSSLLVLALLRHFVLRCLECNIWFRSCHVPGVENKVADALSRFNWQEFQELLPDSDEKGLPCPRRLWDLVIPE